MKITSPISNLVYLLREVRAAAQKYEAKLLNNEAATRAVLIDPVLTALGWDTKNPDMVEFERYFKDTKLDYALYDSNGKVRNIVEAKALGGNLHDTKVLFSLVSYGLTYGITDLFLTNGIVWQHFFDLRPGNIEPKTVDLSKESLVDCAEHLIKVLDAAKYWEIQERKQLNEEIATDQANAGGPIIVGEFKQQRILTDSQNDDDYILLKNISGKLTHKAPPKKFRLPDGSIRSIDSWRKILVESVLFVLANVSDLVIPLPDKAGKTVTLISNQPFKQGVGYLKSEYKHKQVWIYLHYDSNNCFLNARYILDLLPQNLRKVDPGISF